MDSEIGSEGADSRSVAGRCRRVGRDGCLHLAPTPAPSSLDAVLGDERVDLRKVEDLAALDADHSASERSAPQSVQAPGEWLITSSGSTT